METNQTPPEIDEALFLAAWQKAASSLKSKYRFGYYDEDDIAQDVYLLCVAALPKYNPERASGKTPLQRLANFFFIYARNKLVNLKRDCFHRADPACLQCSTGEYCTPGGCEAFNKWRSRNAAKSALFQASAGTAASDEQQYLDELPDEFVARLRQKLPQEFHGDLLRFLSGARFPKGRRKMLLEAIERVLSCD